MAVSSQQYDALLKSLGMAPAQAEAEARRAPRLRYNLMVNISPWSENGTKVGAPRQQAKLVDASAQGIGLLSQMQMEAGSQFVLHLVQGKKVTDVLCKVVHCRPARSNLYDVGAAFIRTLGKTGSVKHAA